MGWFETIWKFTFAYLRHVDLQVLEHLFSRALVVPLHCSAEPWFVVNKGADE